MDDRISKIAKILNLTTTKSRGKTIGGLIEAILYEIAPSKLAVEEIIEWIKALSDLSLFRQEVETALDELVEAKHVLQGDKKYQLSDERVIFYKRVMREGEEIKHRRKLRFIQTAKELSPLLSEDEFNHFWEAFELFIYETFYLYGESAVKHFIVDKPDDSLTNFLNDSPLPRIAQQFQEDQRTTFTKTILVYIKSLSTEDIDFFETLGRKTLSFYSLGLPAELQVELTDLKLIDWTIYLDTNVLYSILGLHSHKENESCRALLQIVREKGLNIKFRVLPLTMKELKKKRRDFEDLIPKVRYRQSHLEAMLQSGKLDDFSQAYYENLLKNPDSTLTPVEVVDAADRTLVHVYKIAVDNTMYPELSEKYIQKKIEDYSDYQRIVSEAREQKGIQVKARSIDQIEHDAYLREVIGYSRTKATPKLKSFSEIRYMGLTLDKLLFGYDKNDLGKKVGNGGFVVPYFYLPSFILNRLLRILPVQTANYKSAFINAIATFTFNQATETSQKVQKFVAYYKSMGLDDEKLLLSFITDDFFIDAFTSESEDLKDAFIESKINEKIKDIAKEKDKVAKDLEREQRLSASSQSDAAEKQKILSQQQDLINRLTHLTDVYEKQLIASKQTRKEEKVVVVQPDLFQEVKERQQQERVTKLEQNLAYQTELSTYLIELDNYEKGKSAFVNSKLKGEKNYVWLFLIWIALLCFTMGSGGLWLYCYFVLYISSPPTGFISIGSVLLSAFSFWVTHNRITTGFKAVFSSEKLRESRTKEFEQQFEKDKPRPVKPTKVTTG